MLTYIHIYFLLTDEQYNKLTTQQRDILGYIAKYGSITPMDAFAYLGITKLSTRISEMKVIGISFSQVYESGVNRSGRKVHYMRYGRAA